tara:strand:+ start:45 stop:545 length:501 start_codon:yes stop_codon:yes gene_type:complete
MSFKLNIGGKMTGKGTTGFGQKASAVIEKCKSMANYMGTLQDNLTGGVDGGAGTPGSFSSNYGGPMANKNDGGIYQVDDKEDNKGKTMAGDNSSGDGDNIQTEKLDNVTMYGKSKKPYFRPSEVGGTDAVNSPSGGASFTPQTGKPIEKMTTAQLLAERKSKKIKS